MAEEKKGLSDKERFDEVRRRAEEMGVIDMNFCGGGSADTLECYENALDVLQKHMDFILTHSR